MLVLVCERGGVSVIRNYCEELLRSNDVTNSAYCKDCYEVLVLQTVHCKDCYEV